MKNFTLISFLLIIFNCLPLFAQTSDENLAKINTEGFQRSEVMQIITDLTDLYGPRLTGTHEYYRAAQWAKKSLEDWGLDKVRLEPYCDDCMGWEVKSFNIEMTAPTYMKIEAYPYAWTESSNGPQEADLVWIEDHRNMEKVKESWHGKLRGKTVLIGKAPEQDLLFDALSERFSEAELSEAEKSILTASKNPLGPSAGDMTLPEMLSMFEKYLGADNAFFHFLKEEGAVGALGTTPFFPGVLHPSGTYNLRENSEKSIPYFAISPEDFGKLKRLIARKIAPTINFHLDSELYLDKKNNVNIIGEITGSDPNLKGEVVMIGAHFDSWHSSSGATDNGAGSAVMMEVMRIIKKSGVKPRRTIRIGLWGGEEQGYIGSLAYAEKHLGKVGQEKRSKEVNKISAYINMDNGAGVMRGIYLQGNEAIRPVFAEMLEPYSHLDVNHFTIQNTNMTDHDVFNYYNIPAFQIIQDKLNYHTVTHHTNLDVLEYVPERDMMINATVIASLVYQIAMRDSKMPRKAE